MKKIIISLLILIIIIGITIVLINTKDNVIKSVENEYTAPFLPNGFTHIEGTDLNTGLVIEDSKGNQYVWVEVPKSTEVYKISGLKITKFTDEVYKNIEKDLHQYTKEYRNETRYIDEFPDDLVKESTGLTNKEYTKLKQKMLKSIYQNGGFYVGRYETGITNADTDLMDVLSETPLIKKDIFPFGELTCVEAQNVASKMVSTKYTSSLLFGVQWDLIMKYLETKGSTYEELFTDSTSWGNHLNSSYDITNQNSKYYDFELSIDVNWTDEPYGNKQENRKIFLSTGADKIFMKQNIFDLAGNAWEWTLEYSSDPKKPSTIRGGSYGHRGNTDSASYRMNCDSSMHFFSFGFRVAIF